MSVDYVVVALLVLAAAAYIGWRWRAAAKKGGVCGGCCGCGGSSEERKCGE